MEFIELILEQAAGRGEFDAPEGSGRRLRIDDADPGWWVRREAARIRREDRAHDAIAEVEEVIGKVWTLSSEAAVRARVDELNQYLVQSGAADAALDGDETVVTWRRMTRLRMDRPLRSGQN